MRRSPSPQGRILRLLHAKRALIRAGFSVQGAVIGGRFKFLVSRYPGSFTPTQIVGLASLRGRW